MQPFKLVPSLTARIPGRSASPLRLKPLKPSQPMGTSRNREPNPVNPQMDQICELQQLCSTHAVTYLIVFVTNGYTYGNLWSCANAIMNSTARRYPSYILKEHQARCSYWKSTKLDVARASVKLPPIFHSRGAHVPSLTLPPFTCAGVSSQRASSERGTVALGLAPATGPQKSPKSTKTPKFQSPKSARR